jgi:hypothetical protein
MSQSDTHGTGYTAPAAPATTGGRAVSDGRGLRGNTFAAAVMLLIEYGLGIWVNLYATIPASDHGKGTFAAFGAAVAHGPVALAVHAVLGTLLIVTAAGLIVRALLARKAATAVIGGVALLAVITAWLSGARFVGAQANGASFSMATATGVALLCYVIILLLPSRAEGLANERR